uniref:Sex-determining region Y protein n=1 Tax=Steinernema glaseri TaxID=37863 RepID=A0A1I7ZQC7_9BILA
MHSNLDVTSEGSRASSPNNVDPGLSSPSPSPSDATHEGGFSQHSFVAPHMSANGHAAIDFSTPLSPGSNGDQHYIKRPLNAYMMWTREERKKILAIDPKKKMHDISREMGERWKSMTDQQKKPYFERAKAQKAEHKKMLKEHPNWLYQPNKSKGRSKKLSPSTNGTATPSTPAPTTPQNGRPAAATANGAHNGSTFQRPAVQQQTPVAAALLSSTPQQPARAPAPGPMRAVPGQMTPGGAQPVAYHPYPPNQAPRYAHGPNGQTYVVHQNGQAPPRHAYVTQALNGKPQPPNGYHPQAKPPNMNQVLDMYYTSLCQPAFPEPGEPPGLGMAPSNLYLDQYHQMQHQEYLQKHHFYQQQNQFTSSNGLTYQSI